MGAAYLLYLAARTLLSRKDSEPSSPEPAEAPLHRAFAEGMLVNVLNPKVALSVLAFVPQFVDPARGGAAVQTLVLAAAFFAVALVMDLLYVVAAGALARRLRAKGAGRQRHHRGYLLRAGRLRRACRRPPPLLKRQRRSDHR